MSANKFIVLLGGVLENTMHMGAAQPGHGQVVNVIKGKCGNWGGCDGLAFGTREEAERYLAMQIGYSGFIAELLAVSEVPASVVKAA